MNSNCKILMAMASAVITVMDLQRYLMLTEGSSSASMVDLADLTMWDSA